MDKELIGRNIKAIRLSEKMNQTQFAVSLGVSQGFLSEIETGKSYPSIECLISLTTSYGIDLNWVITGRQNESVKLEVSKSELKLLTDYRLLQQVAKDEVYEIIQLKTKRYRVEENR